MGEFERRSGLTADKIEYSEGLSSTLYRHHRTIREFLGVKPYDDKVGRKVLIQLALDTAQIVDTP